MPLLLIVVVLLAICFDFINGFHDAANSTATIVSTKVLSLFAAVFWAAAFNFLAYFLMKETKVANTIANIVIEQFITLKVILAGLIAAITWNLITWWFGIPSSSSHTLIGGFAGAGMTNAMVMGSSGLSAVNTQPIIETIAFVFLAPVIGIVSGYVINVLIMYACIRTKPSKAEHWFKRLQLVSSGALSFAHGSNDAQKVMGIIYVALISAHQLSKNAPIPGWIPFVCYTAIALGTLSGGWKIVKTMGTKITKITPLEGVSAETAGALTLFATAMLGIPVSTTHTLTGAITGVGLTKRISAVRWGITGNLILAWIVTIPVSAIMAGLVFLVINAI